MGLFRGIKKIGKPFVNVPAWMSFGMLKGETQQLARSIKTLFIPEQAKHKETFEQAILRFNLSEADIKNRVHQYKRFAAIMLLIAMAIMSYGIYLLISFHLKGAIVAIAISTLALAQAFKFHFWSFQLTKRKLGCTMKEWWSEGLWGR